MDKNVETKEYPELTDADLESIYRRGLDESTAVAIRAVYDAGLHPEKHYVEPVVAAPVVAPTPWKGNTQYKHGDEVSGVKKPSDAIYMCETAGRSGNFEPTWTNTTTEDGTVIWLKV